jgi:hypothetical protein
VKSWGPSEDGGGGGSGRSNDGSGIEMNVSKFNGRVSSPVLLVSSICGLNCWAILTDCACVLTFLQGEGGTLYHLNKNEYVRVRARTGLMRTKQIYRLIPFSKAFLLHEEPERCMYKILTVATRETRYIILLRCSIPCLYQS